jgi:mRNA-degrading endonuclease toxin of MazEF toxin-antitoxin module
VPEPEQGRIVLAEIHDPQGRNPKIRPLVIVSETEEIRSDQSFLCVAITSTLPRKLPEDCVLLTYHARGHPRTGLKKRCAAVCSWLVEIQEEDIQRFIGEVSPTELDRILDSLESLE